MKATMENLNDPEWWDLNAPKNATHYFMGNGPFAPPRFFDLSGPIKFHETYPEPRLLYKRPDHITDASKMVKQIRYQDQTGDDWIDEFARTATKEEFRGAMRFTIGKYNRRMGKKDARISEIEKMEDYCRRWREKELKWQEGEQ